MQFNIRKTSVLIALAFSSAAAHATDGYFQHATSVRAQGTGGAGIALPQDGLAAATNPAGTAFVGARLDLGVTWFSPDRGAEIVGNGGGADGALNGNGKRHFFIPELGYVRAFSPSLSAGLAVYGNGGMNTTYNGGVPLFGSGKAGVNLEQLFISPNLAWKIDDANAVGAALNFAYQRFEASGLQNFDNPYFTVSPGNVTNRGTDTSTGWGVRLGWSGKITPYLTLGATWSSKIKAGKFSKYQGLFASGGSFDIPENFGLGLAYKVQSALTVAADVQRIRYADVASVGAPLANLQSAPLGAAKGPGFGWRNTTAYKIGAVYALKDDVTLRAGYNHTSQPVSAGETLFNILAPGVVQDHVSLGASFRVAANGELSVAYTHAFSKTVRGASSIPPAFGGGNANVRLGENILGVAYAWKL